MNYQNVYKMLMDRGLARTRADGAYLERHHIVPDFMFEDRARPGPKGHLPGNPNDPSNIAMLTPREHFIAHVLLVKMHRHTRYYYQCASALQFFYTKTMNVNHPRYASFNCADGQRYERYRLLGLKALSEKAKGQIVVKDAATGELIGKVSNTHPSVLNGTWVHHSKGMKPTDRMLAARANRKTAQAGMNNPNARPDCTKEQIMECLVEYTSTRPRVFKLEFVAWLKQQLQCSERIIVNRFGNFSNFVDETNRKYELSIQYDPYYRDDRKKD